MPRNLGGRSLCLRFMGRHYPVHTSLAQPGRLRSPRQTTGGGAIAGAGPMSRQEPRAAQWWVREKMDTADLGQGQGRPQSVAV